MSDAEDQGDHGAGPAPEPGTPEPAKLRRTLFGYKRADVDRALEDRDALLAELRQDVAALWLAFAQHDRMIGEGTRGADARSPIAPRHEERDASPASERAAEPTAEPSPDALAAAEGAIGRQLSDLDEVLAAIEMATQTLERAYAEEIVTEPEHAAGLDGPQPEVPPDAIEVAEPDPAPSREGQSKS